MKTQQIFVSSLNRDSGTPNDMFITFPNGLVKETSTASTPPRTSIELAEFALCRFWYDVQPGFNDSFRVYSVAANQSYTINIPPGWYTVGQDTISSGVAIEPVLTNLLTTIVGGVWLVVIDARQGVFNFRTPAAGGSGYSFNFITQNNRCQDLLGFNKGVYVAINDVIVAPKPFNLTRTCQLVMHTDIQPAFPQCTIDNYPVTRRNFDNSDIMAVIPVDQPPRGIINYQSTEKINRIWIKPEELRTVRIFFTDQLGVQLDMALCEWTAVLRVVYGDNLSV